MRFPIHRSIDQYAPAGHTIMSSRDAEKQSLPKVAKMRNKGKWVADIGW